MGYRWTAFYDKEFPASMEYPDKTMYELFAGSARSNADLIACSFMGTGIRFRQLSDTVDQVAEQLSARGMQKGEVATICLPNIPQAVIAFYALNRLGLIANMVHPLTPSQELEGIIRQTGSRYLFTLDAFLPKYEQMLPTTENVFTVVCAIGDYLSPIKKAAFYLAKGRKISRLPPDMRRIPWPDLLKVPDGGIGRSARGSMDGYVRRSGPKDCAVYLHSGGTMGSPKTIMLSSYNMNVLALQGPAIIGIGNPAGTSMATILPLFHGFGLCMGMHTMMVNGITAILVPVFSAENLASLLRKEKPNFIAAVPTLLEGIMKNKKLAKTDLSYLKAVFCGGDTLTEELKSRFDTFLRNHRCTCTVREGYGLTETVTVCAVNPIVNNRPGTVGIPLADMVMKITEPGTFSELPAGSPGEICISGPTMMLGYLNDPEATALAIRTHPDGKRWVHSGDYGFMDTDGYFHFTQRIKRIIKVSGIPVFPSQIEEVISRIPGVREVSAIGIPHPYKMQVVKAFVVPEEGISADEGFADRIRKVCEEQMIHHAVPAKVEFRKELPRTKVGKVDTVSLEKEPQ
ncbi:MAG: class I adenylate-forming enzyme family protein [Saccharofermentanales bacterium]